MLGLLQTKCVIAVLFVEAEPLQHLRAANSVLKRVMSASENALNEVTGSGLRFSALANFGLRFSILVNNTDDVNHSELTNLLFDS